MTSWVPFDLLDHLWQSTLFAAAVWLVARTLRANGARVRYWLWFAASMKFLIPLSLLVSAGERFAWRTEPTAPPIVSFVIDRVIDPVLTPAAATVATAPAAPIAAPAMVMPWLLAAWAVGVTVVLISWRKQWRTMRRALADAHVIDLSAACSARDFVIMASPSMIEPGVFGIRRPVLIVPAGIGDRLAPAQLQALIAHEHCHVRHRDNLTAALHMAVEALFWFYPVVWWIERRLIEERERACDEFVLQSGSTPHDYAEGIIEVCRLATEPPPVFVAGVSGSDLKRRIQSILKHEIGRPLSVARIVVLCVCSAAAGVAPLIAGAVTTSAQPQQNDSGRIRALNAHQSSASFEVVSIRKSAPGNARSSIDAPPGRWTTNGAALRLIITQAFQIQDYQLIDAPSWINNAFFDINARLPEGTFTREQRALMVQAMLTQRFGLVVRRETRHRPVYHLVLARRDGTLGRDMQRSTIDCEAIRKERASGATAPAARRPQPGEKMDCSTILLPIPTGGMALAASAMRAEQLPRQIAQFVNRPVIDQTGLTGEYDLVLRAIPESGAGRLFGAPSRGVPPPDSDVPVIFTALQEQLGLRLESATGPVDVLVIDRVAEPTEN